MKFMLWIDIMGGGFIIVTIFNGDFIETHKKWSLLQIGFWLLTIFNTGMFIEIDFHFSCLSSSNQLIKEID